MIYVSIKHEEHNTDISLKYLPRKGDQVVFNGKDYYCDCVIHYIDINKVVIYLNLL